MTRKHNTTHAPRGSTMFKISIETGNAAFGPTPADRAAEIAAILRSIADRLDRTAPAEGKGRATDHYGNTVGAWALEPFDYAAHGETDPDDEEDAPSVTADDIGEIACTYGRGTPATCYTWEDMRGTWYAVEGSQNVNHTADAMPECVDVEELADDDTGTADAPINSAEDMARFCADL